MLSEVSLSGRCHSNSDSGNSDHKSILAANYKGAQGLTRATSQSSLGKFLIGFQLSTFFENEQIYSNISTVGSHVALDLKYDTSSSDNIVDCYSFFHNILRLDPVTRMYSIASQ